MSIFDKLSERVGDFLGEVLLPEDVRQSHERAARAMQRGEYKIALLTLEEAERRRPNVERTRHLMGQCYFYDGNLIRAVELFKEALALREEPSTHFYYGLALEQLGQYADAQVH
ncbi:MAG: tetratricopeptide repeat protein, partial [Bradymonadaceae bacterium]